MIASASMSLCVSVLSLPVMLSSSPGAAGDLNLIVISAVTAGMPRLKASLAMASSSRADKDAAVDDPLIPLVNVRGCESRAACSLLRIDLKINGEAAGVLFAAYVAALVVAKLVHTAQNMTALKNQIFTRRHEGTKNYEK